VSRMNELADGHKNEYKKSEKKGRLFGGGNSSDKTRGEHVACTFW
jgi:hypothetical protein